MKRKWIAALGAGGAMLGVGAICQASPLPMSAGAPTLDSHGSASLAQGKQGAQGEADRLSRLRALVHNSSIHCSNPGCPICHPQPSASL
ncbi:hypothetical protein [Chromobacterium subtsugae]|uniref:hypothetical protein n=1 Tax=Chromobacterium subtsugae TaxID=251747 RepID=UPI0006412BE9|nr:hypothetical protein [Chromobacterium subtsugae]OBU85563.1 hypothetical protein MY55_15345 [Chromobacterium subtsugae]